VLIISYLSFTAANDQVTLYTSDSAKNSIVSLSQGGMVLIALLSGGDYDTVHVQSLKDNQSDCYKSEYFKTPFRWNSPSVQPNPTQQPLFRILGPTLMATQTP
jgi:hypothetical protein